MLICLGHFLSPGGQLAFCFCWCMHVIWCSFEQRAFFKKLFLQTYAAVCSVVTFTDSDLWNWLYLQTVVTADGSFKWLNFSTASPCFTNWRILLSHYWFAHNKINHWSVKLNCIPYQSKAPSGVLANEPADRALRRSPRVLWDVLEPSVTASCPLCQIPFNHRYWLFLIGTFGFHLVWWTLLQ